MFLFRSLVLLLFFITIPRAVNADPEDELRQAQKLLTDGNYSAAYLEYQQLAEATNNPSAHFSLALFYEQGWGRAVDQAKACRHYKIAAEADIPVAVHAFADCLRDGEGQPANPQLAAQWYQKAVELAYYPAFCSLAELYVTGRGVGQDITRGLELCQQAAQRGNVAAMEHMARFYMEGDDALRDPIAAQQWLLLAAQKNSPPSQYHLAVLLREGGGQNPDKEDLTTALFWFESAASQGYMPAYFPTAELYFKTPKDSQTQLWPEEALAKAYLWLSATQQRSIDPAEKREVRLMQEQVMEVIPATWVKDLNAQVAAHLALHTQALNQ